MYFWLTKKTAYNDFFKEFSQTRKTPLPEFSLFINFLFPPNEQREKNAKKILYIGCGNGRNIPLLQKNGAKIYALDASEELLKEAKKNIRNGCNHSVKFIHGYAEKLPFANETFDAVIAFASLHHIGSKKKREKAFSEAFRVLKKNGVFLGTVWNLHQKQFEKYKKKAKKRALFLPWWSENDFCIPWGKQKLPRLYYRFSARELENLLKRSGFTTLSVFSQNEHMEKTEPYGGKNICFFAKKEKEKKRIFILGIPFDPITKKQVLKKMEQAAQGKKQVFATTPNPEICMAAQKDKKFLSILQSADLSFADGIGILWASNQWGMIHSSTTQRKNKKRKCITHKKKSLFLSLLKFALNKTSHVLPEQICGSDVFREFCTTSKEPIFLLGGAQKSAKKCQKIFGKNIVDIDAGSSTSDDEERIINKINTSGAKVLFVAFGAPTQEKWIQKNLKKMPNIKLAMGVGGSFDFIAGVQKRAPKLVQKLGGEWLWRLLLEPKKRGKRICTAVWSFPREVWKS